jgi:hypothetical protein
MSKKLYGGSYDAYAQQVASGTLLATDVEKMMLDVKSACGVLLGVPFKNGSDACTKAKDTLLFNAYDEQTKKQMFAQYPEQQAYKDFLNGKKDSDANRTAFYEASMHELVKRSADFVVTGAIQVGKNDASIFDQTARGQLNVLAAGKALDSASFLEKTAIAATKLGRNLPLVNKLMETRDFIYNGTDRMGADHLNAQILQTQLRNYAPETFDAVQKQYETDPEYLKAKKEYEKNNKGKTYTTEEYQRDLLATGIQIERKAESRGFLWFDQTPTRISLGSQSVSMLADDSRWLEQGILTGQINPNTLQSQLDALQTNKS